MYTMHWTEGFRPTQLQRSRAAAAEHAILVALLESGPNRRGPSLRRLTRTRTLWHSRRRNVQGSRIGASIRATDPTLRDEARTNARPASAFFVLSMAPARSKAEG